MNKKDIIAKIDNINSLSSLMIDVCKEIGLKNVNKLSDEVISAMEEGALKITSIKLILTLSELRGKTPRILDLFKEYVQIDEEVIIITSNPKKISEYFKKWIITESNTNRIDFWDQDLIINKVDKYLSHYWTHNDMFVKSYEEKFLLMIGQETELKKILKLERDIANLLDVFIEPKIYIFKEDSKTNRSTRIRIPIDRLLRGENYFISGDAGTGKSTLLKELGKMIVSANKSKNICSLPLFIKPSNIQDNEYSIDKVINNLLNNEFGVESIDWLYENYHLVLLIDSIDEFEKKLQKKILEELSNITSIHPINFILCTRNYENLIQGCTICDHYQTYLSNFDQRQVKQYLDNFFKFDLAKSDQLWENLLDNKILDKIPATPLTISLISILYEGKQYEVPATLTDVYDNFNQFLLGRVTVRSRLEFLDITIKERLLSIYALDIISTSNRKRKTKNEFIEFVKDFFKKRSITINEELVPELLRSLIEGTGILYIDDKELVAFKHDHFMEYYASREIFISHDRNELEESLVGNFTEYNWQNTAIFYAGRTKDMPIFLRNIINRTDKYRNLDDCILAVSGLGYILQSLWMTDSHIRKDGVIKALDLIIKADSRIKQLASEKVHFFKGIRDIDIAFMNLVWFYNHFNSIAIKDPLNLAYEEIYDVMNKTASIFDKDKQTRLYQLFCIASTLDSGRNADSTKLEQLFDEHEILNNPFFVVLFEEGSKILELTNEKRLKEQRKTKNKLKHYIKGIRFYLETPSEDLRHTTYELLAPIKKVKIYTEGKTDSTIISQAFSVLTYSTEPYWSISSMDRVKSLAGGAYELKKHLEELGRKSEFEENKDYTVIGIFDNDSKGNQEFGGLDARYFKSISDNIKKHKSTNIYGITIPIPEIDCFAQYRVNKQEFRLFEIEHYFPQDLLNKYNMITNTAIPGVQEITGDKVRFAEEIQRIDNEEIFKNFSFLFRLIDDICDKEINYID